MTYGAQFNS